MPKSRFPERCLNTSLIRIVQVLEKNENKEDIKIHRFNVDNFHDKL